MEKHGPKSESAQERAVIEERRKFLKKAGKTALTAPAVALLLSAESKQASAGAGVVSGVTIPY